jgi:hypothetical protein
MEPFIVLRDNKTDIHTYALTKGRDSVTFNKDSEEILKKHGIQFEVDEWADDLNCSTYDILENVFSKNNLDFIIDLSNINNKGIQICQFYCALRYSNFNMINYFVQEIRNNNLRVNTDYLSIVAERWDDDVQILDLIVSNFNVNLNELLFASAKCNNINMWKYIYGILILKDPSSTYLIHFKQRTITEYKLYVILSYLLDNNGISEEDIIEASNIFELDSEYKGIIREAIDSGKLIFNSDQLSEIGVN